MKNPLFSSIWSLLSVVLILQSILGIGTSFGYILTKSAPVYYKTKTSSNASDEAYLYFQGQDNGLYKIKYNDDELCEGTWDDDNNLTSEKAIRLGGEVKILSKPCVGEDDWIYFQGEGNELFKTRTDGGKLTDLGVKTLSTPALDVQKSIFGTIIGAYLYFQGEENELFVISANGSAVTDLHVKTFSTPCVESSAGLLGTTTYVFFQGTDNFLFKLELANNSSKVSFLNDETLSSPCLREGTFSSTIYFKAYYNKLKSVDTDANESTDLDCRIFSAPYVDKNGRVYFQGRNSGLYSLQNRKLTDLHHQTKSTPCTSDDGWIYFQTPDNRLRALPSNIHP